MTHRRCDPHFHAVCAAKIRCAKSQYSLLTKKAIQTKKPTHLETIRKKKERSQHPSYQLLSSDPSLLLLSAISETRTYRFKLFALVLSLLHLHLGDSLGLLAHEDALDLDLLARRVLKDVSVCFRSMCCCEAHTCGSPVRPTFQARVSYVYE
jgi:hypothetical protein